MNNKGIELAINQVVILIISIVILGLGVALLFKIFGVAEQQTFSADERLVSQLEQALDTGDVVQIPRNIQRISPDEMGRFALGILHDPAVSVSDQFSVEISPKSYVAEGNLVTYNKIDMVLYPPGFLDETTRPSDGLSILKGEFVIGEFDKQVVSFGVSPNAGGYEGFGQYFFEAAVYNEGNLYGKKTFSVIVE